MELTKKQKEFKEKLESSIDNENKDTILSVYRDLESCYDRLNDLQELFKPKL